MKGYVYLLCDGERFKIGMTTRKNINKRISELQTGNSDEIWVHTLYETDHPHTIEKMMHTRYASSNIKNEWFELTPSQVVNFKNNCNACEELIHAMSDNPFICG